MKTRNPIVPTPPAALVTGVLAGVLTIALGVTQPASAATMDGASTGVDTAVTSAENRPTGRFLKQPLRLPPAA